MATKTVRMNQFVENMLNTLILVQGDDNANKAVCEAIQYVYENDEQIKDIFSKVKEGLKIYAQEFVAANQKESIIKVVEAILSLADRMVIDNKSNVLVEVANVKVMAEQYLESLNFEEDDEDIETDTDKVIKLNRIEAMVRELVDAGALTNLEHGMKVVIQVCDLVEPTNSCLALLCLKTQYGGRIDL